MITKATEYHYVDNLDDIKVNGEIMPLRENPYELRGEDIAFLAEAKAEIQRMSFYEAEERVSMADRRLLADRVNYVCAQGPNPLNYFSDTVPYEGTGTPFHPITAGDDRELVCVGDVPKTEIIYNTFVRNDKIKSFATGLSSSSMTNNVSDLNYIFQGRRVDEEEWGPVEDLWNGTVPISQDGIITLLEYNNTDTAYEGTLWHGYDWFSRNKVIDGLLTVRILTTLPQILGHTYLYLNIDTAYQYGDGSKITNTYYWPQRVNNNVATFDLAYAANKGAFILPDMPLDHSVNLSCSVVCHVGWIQRFRSDHTIWQTLP